MNAKIEEAEKYIKEKNRYLQDIADLKSDLAREKKNHQANVLDCERNKLEATERLRKEMLKQIKMTKASLLAL